MAYPLAISAYDKTVNDRALIFFEKVSLFISYHIDSFFKFHAVPDVQKILEGLFRITTEQHLP